MPEFRHYRLDGAGKISSAEWLEAPSGDEAVRQVRARKLPVASEIWDGKHLIARIEPSRS